MKSQDRFLALRLSGGSSRQPQPVTMRERRPVGIVEPAAGLIAVVPGSCFRIVDPGLEGIEAFPLPVATPEIAVSAVWHPRMDADPAHRLLRQAVIATCRDTMLNTLKDSFPSAPRAASKIEVGAS